MINRKIIYIFFGVATLISFFIDGLFVYVLPCSIVFITILNRGLFITLRANKHLTNKDIERGYYLLGKAYKAGSPFVVINGYIYLSLKYGYYDKAREVIDNVLSGKVHFKLKDGQKEAILSQKAIYLWKTVGLDSGIELLEELYADGYKTTPFYGNLGCLLQLNGDLDRAEEISLEGYDYGNTDKVTLDNLVAIYIDKKEWENADRFFNELIILNPSFTEAYYHGAILELNKNNLVEAQEYLNKALKYELTCISSITQENIDKLKIKIEAKL